MKTDLQIAQEAVEHNIYEIAVTAGLLSSEVLPYGSGKAKILPTMFDRLQNSTEGKLILVTALNPTPAGEGKTTTSIGLADALRRLGKNAMLALREPSLGPVFGIKGGAAGGGYSQVIPMEDINLHFTGDMHAVAAANNLLCALIDNHIQHGNQLDIDVNNISFRRCMDMNDRQLRNIVCGMGRPVDGVPREDGFDITAASEVMAILCMASDLNDLKNRLDNITIGYNHAKQPVTAGDLQAGGAMAVLLKDAIMPNLVQTLEHTPVLMHGGPFANIAHGCNSIIATKTAMLLADYTITEAGFGADLGAEKFLDIKCRNADIWPDAVVLVATVRALKYHGGMPKDALRQADTQTLEYGFANLDRHVHNLQNVYGLNVVVAINQFETDSEEELALLEAHLSDLGVAYARNTAWAEGGAGAQPLAQKVLAAMSDHQLPARPYDYAQPIVQKAEAVATRIYHAKDVFFHPKAKKAIQLFEDSGYTNMPICIAKTQYSFSDDAKSLGAPTGFTLEVRDAKLCSGAGFIVLICGDIMRMPGLPKQPAANTITVGADGKIEGLF